MEKNVLLMAFSTGRQSTEGAPVKRYVGIAPCKVIAINPTKEQLEKIYDTTLDKDVSYVGEADGVKYAKIDFIVNTIEEKCGVDVKTKATFFLRDEFMYNKDKTKIKVIDKYGRTAWATKEEAQAHAIPQYTNGPADIDADYRPLYRGEEQLTGFMKNWLNIKDVTRWVDGKMVPNKDVKDPSECEARFNNIKDFFAGNFKDVKDTLAFQPNNVINLLFGVKTTDDGKEYQTIYTDKTYKGGATNFSGLVDEITERKNNGALSNICYEVGPLKEYVVEATPLDKKEDKPFDSPAVTEWF